MVGTAHERQSFALKAVPTPVPTLQLYSSFTGGSASAASTMAVARLKS
jgi:hypothetical protein